MTIELFIILSILGTSIIGVLNLSIAYLSFRLLSLNKAANFPQKEIQFDSDIGI